MSQANEVVREIRAALESDPRVNLHRATIDMRTPGDKVVLAGEVSDIAAKRRAVARAKGVVNGKDVVDYLCVRPTERLGDGAVRDAIARHLLEEPVFARAIIVCRVAGDDDVIRREPSDADNRIHVAVADGVATLSGQVWSLSHRRLAEVLAWWAPGCRNVVNELDVQPPERDNDGEINDALELVLNKDPVVHSDQITTRVRDGRVDVRGLVASPEEKRRIERDIWYVDGVRDVANELDVYRAPTAREPMRTDPSQFE